MKPTRSHTRPQGGFSLVEVMVGLAIGMIAVIVMMQVFSVSEGYKRTTTGGDDAQNNGAIALYEIQRGIQQSGLGVSDLGVLGCNVQLRAGVTLNTMAPVTINHASLPAGVADANTDTVLVVYGSGNGEDEGENVQAQPSTTTYSVSAAASSASAPGAFAIGDQLIAENTTLYQSHPGSGGCSLTMEPVTALSGSNVTVGTGVTGMTNGVLFNMGQSPKVRAYAVYGGNLTVCDYIANDCGATANVGNAAVWVPIASNVVSLRAEYGRDTSTPMDGTVDVFDQSTPTTACLWSRVSAVRLVLVARSAQYQKPGDNAKYGIPTAAEPAWASASTPINLSGFANWQQYRYKTFQTTVPMRNIVWAGVQAGC